MSILKRDQETADVATLVATVQDGERLVAILDTQCDEVDRKLRAARDEMATAAYAAEAGTGNDKTYETLAREVERLEATFTRKKAALDGVSKQLVADRKALSEATSADRERDARRYAEQRDKAVADIITGYQQINTAWQRLHEINGKMLTVFPALAMKHGGCLISPTEVTRALEGELARISTPPPLSRNTCPALPGAKTFLIGNPASQPPLSEVMDGANALLIRRVVEAGVEGMQPAGVEAVKPAGVPEPDILPDLEQPHTAAVTVNAQAVMPERRKLA